MRRRGSRWRWPACGAVAATLLLGFVFLTPRGWIAGFFSPLDLERSSRRGSVGPWLELLPPPDVAVVPTPPPRTRPASPDEPPPDADWWSRGWRVRVAAAHDRAFAATAEDSVAVLLDALAMDRNLAALARPDSVLAARLILLRRQEGFRFDELKPFLGAMSRARAYRDIQARAADMYGDFLRQEIIVPD